MRLRDAVRLSRPAIEDLGAPAMSATILSS
jgi:hypothetical protein